MHSVTSHLLTLIVGFHCGRIYCLLCVCKAKPFDRRVVVHTLTFVWEIKSLCNINFKYRLHTSGPTTLSGGGSTSDILCCFFLL